MLIGDRVRRSGGTAGGSSVVSESSNISALAQRFVNAKREEMSNNVKSDSSSGPTHKKLQSGEQSQPYRPTTVMPNTFTSVKDSGLVLFTLAILAFTLYLSYYLWRKHRCRNMAVLSKGCQYSRLNQTETDEIDSVVFCSEPVQNGCLLESSYADHDNCKPATLEVITDSLVTTSNYSSSHVPNGSAHGDHSVSSFGSDLSDEDLLQ